MGSLKRYILLLCCICPFFFYAQEIELFQQFNGQFDYLSFGNTLNPAENGTTTDCLIFTESSADFQLEPGQTLEAAYLYWAGSGSGDFDVEFNNIPVSSERNFSYLFVSGDGIEYNYFAAFADVTQILTDTGNGNYTLSELDLTAVIPAYCNPPGNSTNFGGWAVTVIYRDVTLPLNQVNIFDGLDAVSISNPTLTIQLDNLNVLDNTGAKIGFLAWEGDSTLANNETLQINGNVISNPPLNPANNAFNSTNSFTGSSELYNMDIDFYNIENNVNPGDTSATIQLTSNQDLVMVNNIITVLNTQLPDATIEIDEIQGGTECGNTEIIVDYTVYNVNSTDVLPANTPIAFYADQTLVGQNETTTILPIGGSENGTITLTIPVSIPADFTLQAFVDDTGNGTGIVNETNEANNGFMVDFHLLLFPEISSLNNLTECDVVGTEFFDLTEAITTSDVNDVITFYVTEDDALNNVNPIVDSEAFENTSNPQTIYVRVENTDCFITDSFEIEIILCPLPDATITIDNNLNACRRRDLTIEYTVYNTLGTAILPAATPITFYTEVTLVGQSQTQNAIPIGGSEAGTLVVTLPEDIPNDFILLVVVDDDGTGMGIVIELNEFNNEYSTNVSFGSIPPISMLPDLLECDEGFNMATFNLRTQDPLISSNPEDVISYFETLEDAIENTNQIQDPEAYQSFADPQTIYVRLENEICFTTASFLLTTENCIPFVPQGFSPNGDGINDLFEITGLLNVFDRFELKIYTREGNLIHTGHNIDGFWDGIATDGLLFNGNLVPVGTYYYALFLNDSELSEPILGFVYVNY